MAPDSALAWQLAVLALGAPAYFWGAFGMGMDLADTFMITGGDHSAVPPVLYAVSGWALVALVGLHVPRAVRWVQARRG